jgi:hypothetical protein
MGARRRALAILFSLMVAMAITALLLVNGSGSVDSQTARRGIRVAGATATDLSLFRSEVLVWVVGRLSATEVGRVRDSSRVAAISAVRTGLLPAVSGRHAFPAIPVEAMSVDPDAYTFALGRAGTQLLGMLERGVVLSRTGASLRKLRAGGHLRLTGSRSLAVSGVVDDRWLGGYEVAMNLERGRHLGIDQVGYLLLRPRGPRDTLETAVRGLLHERTLAFRHPDQGPWFRGGDGTLPLSQVKLRFGEFAVTSLAKPVPDPRWVQANLITRTVPLLGQVRCHRTVAVDLTAAMADLQRQHLEALVDVGAFRRAGGCLQPRPAPAGSGGLSHQTWGIGLDLGAGPRVDQRLVATMARHGFAWGGRWLQPRAGHFEWAGAGA